MEDHQEDREQASSIGIIERMGNAALSCHCFMQIWQTYAEGMSILAFSLLMRYCIKSTMLDLKANNLDIQNHIIKKLRKK